MKRYHILDDIRGLTLVSMIGFHAVWDLNYIFGAAWGWFRGSAAYWWQQSICWTFILLSGFCWSLGRKKLRRGLTVLAAGMLISLVTEVVIPDQRVQFGVLTLLGICMLVMIPLEQLWEKGDNRGTKLNAIGRTVPHDGETAAAEQGAEFVARTTALPAGMGLTGSLLCFFLTRNINEGYLGFERLNLVKLPEGLYRMGDLMTLLGFPDKGFYSADYFSLLPWMFLFVAGYFLYGLAAEKHVLNKLTMLSDTYETIPLLGSLARGFRWLGRHSLPVYLLHQPLIYGVLYLLC